MTGEVLDKFAQLIATALASSLPWMEYDHPKPLHPAL